MSDAIDAVREGFLRASRGGILQAPRVALSDGSALAMLARAEGSGTVAKIVTVRSANAARGLPTLHAAVLWINDETGQPLAVMDGASLTALRTGAASGVATDLLARPDAHILAVVGSGAQAPDQVRGVCTVRDIQEVRITSRDPAHAARLVETLASRYRGIRFAATQTVAKAVEGADVICCATRSELPILDAAHLAPRCHVNAVGAYRPSMAELSPVLLSGASVIAVDLVEACLAEAGDVIQAIRAGAISHSQLVEIGHLLAGRHQWKKDGYTVFKSVGIPAQDWAVARLVVQRASGQSD